MNVDDFDEEVIRSEALMRLGVPESEAQEIAQLDNYATYRVLNEDYPDLLSNYFVENRPDFIEELEEIYKRNSQFEVTEL